MNAKCISGEITVDIDKKQDIKTSQVSSSQPSFPGNFNLREIDVHMIMKMLTKFAYLWKEIGVALGFTIAELEGISCQPQLLEHSPSTFLLEMLKRWENGPIKAQSSQTSIEALLSTLQNDMRLSRISEQLQIELQQLVACNQQPLEIVSPLSQESKPPECIARYAEIFKQKYCSRSPLPRGEWPPVLGSQYSEITIVETTMEILPDRKSIEESLEASFHGNIDELAKNEKLITSLDELFITKSKDCSSISLKVLIEGVAGAGKTTLVQKSCIDWAEGRLFQQFYLVLLISLRKEGIEQAKSLEELLPEDETDLKLEVVRSINNTYGKHLLLILDGYDELNVNILSSNSIIRKIIQGDILYRCAVILTSRPNASEILIAGGWIQRYVKILGFTQDQIKQYVMRNISDNSVAEKLVKSLAENMTITSVSSTPLSCSILLYIFKQTKFTLPSTLTELFDAFIYSLVKRHAERQKHGQKIKNLKNLPQPINSQFEALCKLAYDSLIKGMFIFTSQDIETICPGGDVEQNALSLMTSATSFSIQSEETLFQFLHMTIQEYLAATWITMQSTESQKDFLEMNWADEKMKQVLVFFAGITKLKESLFHCLSRRICYFDSILNLVLIGMDVSVRKRWIPHSYDDVLPSQDLLQDLLQVSSPKSLTIICDFFEIKSVKDMPIRDSFNFETVARSILKPIVSRDFSLDEKRYLAAQQFLCLAYMIAETEDSVLIKNIYLFHQIQEFHLDFCRLTPMDCSVVATFLSNCPYHLPLLRFNFCSLTGLSLEIFYRVSTKTKVCWNECTEVQINYNGPSFSANLSYLPQIPWFKNTKVLSLYGLQYPRSQPPEAFQLHVLLNLNSLTDLTVTVDKIPSDNMSDHEAALFNFFKSLQYNCTLLNLTYDQSPPATNCGLFIQLMSALSQNKCSLTLGHSPVISPTANVVVLPNNTCFKICCNGFVNAVKLASKRKIIILEAYCPNAFLISCNCQVSKKIESECMQAINCDDCESSVLAVVHCSNCGFNLCKNCSIEIHKKKIFRSHKLNPIDIVTSDFSAVSDSILSSSLTVMDISECILPDDIAKQIGAGLAESESLSQLNIKVSDGTQAVYILEALKCNKSLNKLKLSLSEGSYSTEMASTSFYQMLASNTSLTVLDLSGFGITDMVAQHIANGLMENATLQALNINSNDLKNEGAGYILQCLQQNRTLSILKVFHLCIQITRTPLTLNVAIGASNKHSLSLFVSTFVHNTTMEKLQILTGPGVFDLSQCSVTDVEVRKLAAGLTENSSLEELDLSKNNITSTGAACIFSSLEQNTSLKKLLLSHNSNLTIQNSEMFGFRIKQMLSTNISLSALDLSECGITDAVAQQIASGLTENRTLKALSINSDQIKSKGAGYILQSLQCNETLTILRMLNLHIQITRPPLTLTVATHSCDKQSISLFVSSYVHDTTIETLHLFTGCGRVLNLSECCITDAKVRKIAAALTDSKSLEELDLSRNEITSIGAAYIFRSLERNTSLDKLFLSCNSKLVVGNSERFSSSLQQMLIVNKSLSVLDLGHCCISDTVMKHIGAGLTRNKSLKELYIDSEHLTNVGLNHLYQSLKQNKTVATLRQFSIKLKILYDPFGLVVTDYDINAATKLFKVLGQDTVVDKLVICPLQKIKDNEMLGSAVESILMVKNLRILDCSCDSVLAVQNIANALTNNCSVQQLTLKVTSVGASHIFKSLECNTTLEELKLSFNNFHYNQPAKHDDEVLGLSVQEMLIVNKTLRALNLQTCNDVICNHLSTGLAKNCSVKQLVLKVTNVSATHIIFKSLKHNTNLEELELSSVNTRSSKGDIEALGSAIQRMLMINKTLRIFDIQNCCHNKVISNHLATGLAKNCSIYKIILKVTSVDAGYIFKSLAHNTSLEELELSLKLSLNDIPCYHSAKDDGEILGCVMQKILIVNKTLRILNLQCIKSLASIGASHIFESLEHNISLEELTLTSLPKSEDTEALGYAMQKTLIINKTLRVINLQNCFLSDSITKHLSIGLANNSSLNQLILNVTCTGATHLFKSLERNTSLKDLHLTLSRSDGSKTLGVAMEEVLMANKTLRILNLQDCLLSDETASHIATGIAKNSSLKQLILKSSTIGATHIFRSLELNSTLEELDLSSSDYLDWLSSGYSDCQSAAQQESLGYAIERMLTANKSLKLLNMQDCHLSGVIIEHIIIGLQHNNFCDCKYSKKLKGHYDNYYF